MSISKEDKEEFKESEIVKSHRKSELKKLMMKIDEKGYDNVLILDREHASKITEKRQELIDVIKEEEVESIRDLARKVDRDPSNVLEDVRLLFELDIIDVEKSKGRKIPKMAHEAVLFADEIA